MGGGETKYVSILRIEPNQILKLTIVKLYDYIKFSANFVDNCLKNYIIKES